MKPKKLAALLTAATVAMSLCVPVQAEESREFVQLGELECWIEDGEYYTEVDGEVCLVINLAELEWEIEDISMYSNSSWQNGEEYDVTANGKYEGTIDITYGDDSTPIFLGSASSDTETRISYCFGTGFVGPNTYYIDIHSYSSGSWHTPKEPKMQIFSFMVPNIILFDGFLNEAPEKMCLTFLKDGSTGQTPFNYTFYAF